MFTFEYILDMISSISNDDGRFSYSDLDKWCSEYQNKYGGLFPIDENALMVDRILQNALWKKILDSINYYLEDLVDLDAKSLTKDLERIKAISKASVLERDYTTAEKALIVITLFDENNFSALSENEVILYRNLALELAKNDIREGLISVGYGSYGGDGIFECDYELAEKCMLKLMEIVDALPEKGFYANTLGYIYYYGRVGGAPNYEKAHLYFSYGAACGIYESIYKLSDMYLNGYGGIKSRECARKLLTDIYDELFNKFVCGNYSCEFGDVALRLGKIIMNDDFEGFPLYHIALPYLYEARFALSLRNKFGDESVRERLENTISELKEKMNFAVEEGLEIHSLDNVICHNNNNPMIATITKADDGIYNIIIKRKEYDERTPKLLICLPELELCGLFSEINAQIDTLEDIEEGVFEFDTLAYGGLFSNNDLIYSFPHYATVKITKDIFK